MDEETVVEQTAPEGEDSTSFDDKLGAKLGLTEQAPEAEADPAEQPPEEPHVAAQDESEEIDFEDYKIALPKATASKLKSAIEGYKDYTKKTQDAAEMRRQVEVQQQALQAENAFRQASQQELDQLGHISAALKQYESVNWSQLDTDTLIRTKHSRDTLVEERARIEKSLADKRQQLDTRMTALRQQAVGEAAKYLERHIPGWKSGNDVDNGIVKYATSEGLSENDIVNLAIAKPAIIKALHKAAQYDALQAQKSITAKRAATVPPVVKPGAVQQTPSKDMQKQAVIKQLHQAKDPERKKALFDQALEHKLGLR